MTEETKTAQEQSGSQTDQPHSIDLTSELSKREQWKNADPTAEIAPGATREDFVNAMGRPESGSFVSGIASFEEFKTFLSQIPKETITEIPGEDLPEGVFTVGCRYFTSPIPEGYDGYIAIRKVKELTADDLQKVKLVQGAHGIELQIGGLPEFPADKLSFIVDEDGLVTWFPGDFTPSIDLMEATVKLIRTND